MVRASMAWVCCHVKPASRYGTSTERGYEQFFNQNPCDTGILPTVRTKRGWHVWCQRDLRAPRTLLGGEFRGKGLTVAPHSVGGDFTYRWIVPLPAGPLPFVPHTVFGVKDVAETAESHLSADSVGSADSVLSATYVIDWTLPVEAGERNDFLMKLARGLKFNAGLAEAAMADLMKIVKAWHDRALPVISTRGFSETWIDFRRALRMRRIR